MNHDVLLTDGDCRITLDALRSLEKKGVNTVVAADRERALSFFSKFCKRKISQLYPNPKQNRNLFVKAITKIVRESKCNVLFPMCEWGLIPISEHRKAIIPFTRLPLPSHESIMKVFDKSQTIELARNNDIPIPETYSARNIKELKEISDKITYPAVVKPRWSWVWGNDKAYFRRPYYVRSAPELITAYEIVHTQFPFPMIQEYIPGMSRNYSIGVIFSNSKPRAMCAIKVYRAFPISGGNSILRESVKPDPRMIEYATRIFRALDWHGVAELEFKIDPRDNVPKLMEINGRFWASLNVAIDAGVNLPYLLYRLAMDGDIPSVNNYKVGVKDRWIEGDLHHLYNVFRRKFGIQYPSRLRTLLNFLKVYENGLHYDCYDQEDPLPFFVSLYRIKEKNM